MLKTVRLVAECFIFRICLKMVKKIQNSYPQFKHINLDNALNFQIIWKII